MTQNMGLAGQNTKPHIVEAFFFSKVSRSNPNQGAEPRFDRTLDCWRFCKMLLAEKILMVKR